jgi:hypothetical protein
MVFFATSQETLVEFFSPNEMPLINVTDQKETHVHSHTARGMKKANKIFSL